MQFSWGAEAGTRIETPFGSIEASCWGPPPDSAPTIVMLHEGLGCVDLWRNVPEQLSLRTGCGVLAYSRFGYGRSDTCDLPRPLDYMTREGVDVLPCVLDAAGFRRGVLLGHSDGATVAALHGGGVRDHRVRGMILLAPHFFVEDCSVAAIHAAQAAYPKGLRDKLAQYHIDVDAAFRGWSEAWLDPGFRDWNVTAALDHLQVPVLAIQGRGDPYGTAAQVEVIAERMYAPAEIHLLDDCAHAPHLEQPEQTLDLIVEFLTRLQRIDAA